MEETSSPVNAATSANDKPTSTVTPEAPKKGGSKAPVIILVVVGIFLVVVGLCSAAGFFLFKAGKDNTNVIEYNNTTVESRDKVINNIKTLTSSFAGSETFIKSKIADLKTSTADAKKTIEDTEVPGKGKELKDMNLEYVKLAEQLVVDAEEALKVKSDDFDLYIEKLGAYDQTLLKLSQLNIDIADKLNSIVGYKAVPQADIDSLKSQHDQLKKSIDGGTD